jgi:hypothetical protein
LKTLNNNTEINKTKMEFPRTPEKKHQNITHRLATPPQTLEKNRKNSTQSHRLTTPPQTPIKTSPKYHSLTDPPLLRKTPEKHHKNSTHRLTTPPQNPRKQHKNITHRLTTPPQPPRKPNPQEREKEMYLVVVVSEDMAVEERFGW